MRFIVILNEKAGHANRSEPGTVVDELHAAFTRVGVDADIRVPATDKLEAAVRAAAEERPDAVVIGGGDGTVRSAVAALAGTDTVLGVLPLGTLNHFAKDLRMPRDMDEAVASLADGETREVDVGEVNGHVFINNCSLGAYAEAVRQRDRLRAKHDVGKWWAMIRASFHEFKRLRRLRLRMRVEPVISRAPGHSTSARPANAPLRTVRSPVVVVGNNRYSGHLLSQNLRPRLDAGELWLYTVRARRHLAILRMMLQSLLGRLDEAEHLVAEPAREIIIESESGPVPIAADGEVLSLSAPLHFRIRPRALRVLAPRATAAHAARTEKNEANAVPASAVEG